jgi:hypothetical protein
MATTQNANTLVTSSRSGVSPSGSSGPVAERLTLEAHELLVQQAAANGCVLGNVGFSTLLGSDGFCGTVVTVVGWGTVVGP